MSRIPQAVMRQVEQVLNARRPLPKAQLEVRPKLQMVRGLQARDQDGGGTYAEMLIYDEISYFGIMAVDVAEALNGVTGDLHVRINSPGGDVFDGVAIYNMLADHDGRVTVTVDGLAASAASFIAMAGDEIEMKRAAQMMIHDAMGVCIGNAAEMTETASLLERVSDIIASIYADRTGSGAATWRKQMQAESWYTAQEAVDSGLATKLAPKAARGADVSANFDLSIFRYPGRDNAPTPEVAAVASAATAEVVEEPALEDEPATDDLSTREVVEETAEPNPLTVEDLAAYDPDVFKAALATAADGFMFEPDTFRSAVAKAAGFDFDGDVFKAALELHSGSAPAAPQREEPAPAQDSYDATTVTRAIREAIR